MFQTKVNKDVLLGKIKEEISKLEVEWGDELYKTSELGLSTYIQSNKMTLEFMNRHRELHNEKEFWDIRRSISVYENIYKVAKRVSRLNRVSKMISMDDAVEVAITEDDYKFIYETKPTKKVYFRTYEEHLKSYEEFKLKRAIPKYDPAPLRDVCESKPQNKRSTLSPPPPTVEYNRDNQGLTSQEALWLLWLIGGIVTAIIILFACK